MTDPARPMAVDQVALKRGPTPASAVLATQAMLEHAFRHVECDALVDVDLFEVARHLADYGAAEVDRARLSSPGRDGVEKALRLCVEFIRMFKEDGAALLGEGVHTGLRKGTDADDAAFIWRAIDMSKTTAWRDATTFAHDPFFSMWGGDKALSAGNAALATHGGEAGAQAGEGVWNEALEAAAKAVESLRREVPYDFNRHPCTTTMSRAAAAIRGLKRRHDPDCGLLYDDGPEECTCDPTPRANPTAADEAQEVGECPRVDEADLSELDAFLAAYPDEPDGDLVNRIEDDDLLTWGILRRIRTTFAYQREEALASMRGGEVEREAARWRALISSDRIRVMGVAGFDCASDGSVTLREGPGWHHMGLEVWDSHPAKGDESDVRGRKVLLAYVDHRAALRADAATDEVAK